MAWPKKGTRRLTIDEITYLWQRDGDWLTNSLWTVIKQQGTDGQLLYLGFYGVEIRPRIVRNAIEFALFHGWEPNIRRKPMYLCDQDNTFKILADESSRGHCRLVWTKEQEV